MLFNRPMQSVQPSDIQELCDKRWPESDEVEYKQCVPGKDGPDTWHGSNGPLSEFARDKLLCEIVAFANSRGGHLIVGIVESKEKPSRATEVLPVPRVADLADRLLQQASALIAPQIHGLQIRGILCDATGSGFLVARVPMSRNRPHRLESQRNEFSRHCYVRRGERTEALTMREVQDITLNTARGLDAVDGKLSVFKSEFESMLPEHYNGIESRTAGCRASLVPVLPLSLSRQDVYDIVGESTRNFVVAFSEGPAEDAGFPKLSVTLRPVLRGIQLKAHDSVNQLDHKVFTDGSQSLCFLHSEKLLADFAGAVDIGWIRASALTILAIAERMAEGSSSPATEFALEVQIAEKTGCPRLAFHNQVGRALQARNLLFPRLSFVSELGNLSLLTVLEQDIANAFGFDTSRVVTGVARN